MAITRLVWASCDGWELDLADYRAGHCAGKWDDAFETIEEAKRTVRTEGWTVGTRVLCPACVAALKALKAATAAKAPK